ncbi:MAG: hypothetical protein L6Q65_12770 [Zoogloea sp.]|nr:hypothetical protein [Zoogloea sp.]
MARQPIPLHLGALVILSAATLSAAAPARASETISATDGHFHVAFASSSGANLKPDAVEGLAREVGSAGFLQLKAEDSANPLAPCALLSAALTGAHVNQLFFEIVNSSLKTPPFGSNIFGKYDWKQMLWGGGLPDDPNTAADALARISVYRAWGINTLINTHIAGQTQAGCLEQLTDPQRIVLDSKEVAISFEHQPPVSLFFTSTSRAEGHEHLAQLEKLEFLSLPASDRSNPLSPCSILRSLRLGARLNEDVQTLGSGKLRIPDNALLINSPPVSGQSKPLPAESPLKPLADKLHDPAFLRSGSPEAAVVVSQAFGHEIVRTNQLTEMLLDASHASQLDCINEIRQPSTLRLRLIEKKISLPLR